MLVLRRNHRSRRVRKSLRLEWFHASDIEKRVGELVELLGLDWIKTSSVHCFRSENANTRAIARIWGLSRIWQIALGIRPAYVLEVVSEKFDRLNERQKDEVLLHELAHIPKNFSGALAAHSHRKGAFHDRLRRFIVAYRNG